ncbi:MAG: ATP-binding protein [Dehalococcoidales bacterium]|nr:ATP-binding protein [Dehalococcoidales bacterium]
MTSDTFLQNAAILEEELTWLQSVLEDRIRVYFNPDTRMSEDISVPVLTRDSFYARFINGNGFTPEERIVLTLALAPEIKPHILDILFTRNKLFDRGFTEFGGIRGQRHGGFIPTIQTALFILAGEDIGHYLNCSRFFQPHHPFCKLGILDIDKPDDGEPYSSTPLCLSRDTFSLITQGHESEPEFSENFPARKLDTKMEWDDLILPDQIREELAELVIWMEHGEKLRSEWKLEKRVRPGYTALFYGPPGTGKTLSASLLGKQVQRDVYRIDLSQLISKYIGETEKNLEKIFQQAEKKDWILFFDEADSLFGKRTRITDAHDRYANQGISYLLQRLEECPNMVILASNLRANLDDAFIRRFQSIIYFPVPEKEERLNIWQKSLSPVSVFENGVDIDEIAEKYELSGGAIVNVIRYCSMMTISEGTNVISRPHLMSGIKREYSKEGRFL